MFHFKLLLVALITYVSALHPRLESPIDGSYETFVLWMKEFGITYESVKESNLRYKVWSGKVGEIEAHNLDSTKSWKKGLNQFSASTWYELQSNVLMDSQDCSATDHNSGPKPFDLNQLKQLSNGSIPTSIDWRDEKVVSEVKNQGNCGSCWTFSTTGCLEAHNAINTGQMIEFSEQNLVDCANAYNNAGCDGGLPSQAFEYVRFNEGLNTEFSYPYTAKDGNCSFKTTTGSVGGIVDSVYNITEYDENGIYDAVGLKGPVSIAFDVVSDFFDYTSGIYESTTCGNTSDSVNHAVLIVGYGSDQNLSNGMPYWIVKNSWSWGWGNQGYFYIEAGVNMCGLATCASFPILMN